VTIGMEIRSQLRSCAGGASQIRHEPNKLATEPLRVKDLPHLPSGRWQVQPEGRSSLDFVVRARWGAQRVHGRFHEYFGELEVRDGRVSGTLSVLTASLDTGRPRRDRHLRGVDCFDVSQHPRLTFVIVGVRRRGDRGQITGQLTVKGTGTVLAFPISVRQVFDGHLRIATSVSLKRASLGVSRKPRGMVRGPAHLHAALVLTRIED
jgi:polyisoprenoid-binding protein YceI